MLWKRPLQQQPEKQDPNFVNPPVFKIGKKFMGFGVESVAE
uniref:Cytochrome P450 n=1 Tax=Echinococcus granulosus TaxID=6210 RepID=A0A068WFU6_ECHGR|nr:hypothetical protein EgrG_000890900 [Echinococcus granulosus]